MIRRLAFWIADYCYVLRSWIRVARSRSRPWPEPVAGQPDAVGVLLLPGIYESWRFLEPLALRLLAAGHPVHVAPLGLNRAPVRASADRVHAALAGLPPGPLVIVAHSKGGLIGKQLMLDAAGAESGAATTGPDPAAAAAGPDASESAATGPDASEAATTRPTPRRDAARAEAARAGAVGASSTAAGAAGAPEIRGMVTINTPFDGSAYARYFPLAAVRALSPRALRALAEERAVDRQIVAVRASWDPHIPGAGELPDATNVTVPAMGHFRILADAHTQDVVLSAVTDLDAGSVGQ